MMEMRKSNGQYFISVFYKNSTDEPKPLKIKNCGTACPLDTMFKMYENLLPVDWESECKLSLLSMPLIETDLGSSFSKWIPFLLNF